MSVVPANFLFRSFVLTQLFHFSANSLNLFVIFGLTKLLPEEGVLLQALVQKFEQMSAHAAKISLTRVFLMHLEVLMAELVQVVNTCWVKEGRVLKDRLTRHDTIAPCQLQGVLHIFECRNTAVDNDGNLQLLLDLTNHVVISVHDSLLIVFLQTAVDCNQ